MQITKENLNQIVRYVLMIQQEEYMLFLGRSDMDSFHLFLKMETTNAYQYRRETSELGDFDILDWRGVRFIITFIGE